MSYVRKNVLYATCKHGYIVCVCVAILNYLKKKCNVYVHWSGSQYFIFSHGTLKLSKISNFGTPLISLIFYSYMLKQIIKFHSILAYFFIHCWKKSFTTCYSNVLFYFKNWRKYLWMFYILNSFMKSLNY